MRQPAALFLSNYILGIGADLVPSLLGVRSTMEDFFSLAVGIALESAQ